VKTVRVQYFAALREQAGCREETLATTAATLAVLYAELQRSHGFTIPAERLSVALNDDFSGWSAPLADGATVVFLPPFAGG
jgi:molybdopterin converting factor small subunit